jgi:hypothetical protein
MSQGCMQIGMVCGNGRFCPPGKKCARSGGCLDVNSVDCGGYACLAGGTCCNGHCCSPGQACTTDGCKQIGMQCGNSRFCTPGFRCSSGGGCIPINSVDCGGGRSCPVGSACTTLGCKQIGAQCGDGHFCEPEMKCSAGGGCVPINSVDCGGGRYCAIGTICQGNSCINPNLPPAPPLPDHEWHIAPNSGQMIVIGTVVVVMISWLSAFMTKKLSGNRPPFLFLREVAIASLEHVAS